MCLNIDDDKYGHDFLGEAKFPLHRLKPGVMRDLCLNLEKHIPVHEISRQKWCIKTLHYLYTI